MGLAQTFPDPENASDVTNILGFGASGRTVLQAHATVELGGGDLLALIDVQYL